MSAGLRSPLPASPDVSHPIARPVVISAEHEQALARAYQAGDRRAGDSLMRAHLGFVRMIAHEYRRWDTPMEDIVQQGNLGLLKAAQRFEPQRGCRLVTYAAFWIRAEIREYVMRGYRVVRLGTSKAERRVIRMYRRTGESEAQALSASSGLSVPAVERLLPLLTAREASVDQPGPSGVAPLERLSSPDPTPEDEAMSREQAQQTRREIARFLRGLAPRERFIVRARYLSEAPQTLEQIGTRFGISKERVRQLEARALGQLRVRLLASRGLAEAC